jgi:hypothetical protein
LHNLNDPLLCKTLCKLDKSDRKSPLQSTKKLYTKLAR